MGNVSLLAPSQFVSLCISVNPHLVYIFILFVLCSPAFSHTYIRRVVGPGSEPADGLRAGPRLREPERVAAALRHEPDLRHHPAGYRPPRARVPGVALRTDLSARAALSIPSTRISSR